MNQLHRSRDRRLVAGVAGGLAESFHLPVWLVRLLFILALLPGGIPGLLIYVVLWVVLPERTPTAPGVGTKLGDPGPSAGRY